MSARAWRYECSIETAATPQRLWELFADVAGWRAWNAGIESIQIHGPFDAGTTFTMKPPGVEPFMSTLLDVRVNAGFTDETLLGATRVVVRHELGPLPAGGTRVTYATQVTGPDAAALGPLVTADFPEVLQALRRRAETPR